MPTQLPVHDCLPQVLAAVGAGKPVVLRAPPGAGKTTGVPPALLECDDLPPGQILLLQPRRIAARAAAKRLSQLAGRPVGERYGYHVRFDRKVSSDTRVIAMTTGILLRRLTADPLLDDVSCVILDEFHERSLEIDLALGMLQRIRATLRPELRLIVMSATLDTEPVTRLITDAEIIESHGRAYDVDIRYQNTIPRGALSRDAIANQVVDRIPSALDSSSGDVLVFLPGVGEIHRTATTLQNRLKLPDVQVCKLYGEMAADDQDDVLAPSKSRKIVLATNVAETSITIPNVTCVIDSGLARVMQYDTSVGIPCLNLQPISRASADQRAGRAGRTAPGICYRLWSAAVHRSRVDQTAPEIARADLSSAILMLAAWGERDVLQFPWVTPPAQHAIDAATLLLQRLGAIDSKLAITEMGLQMNQLPVHPRLSKLMIAAAQWGCVVEASLAAALLSERDPLRRDSTPQNTAPQSSIESDLLSRVLRLQQHLEGRPDPAFHPGAVKTIARVASQLRRMVETESTSQQSAASRDSLEQRFSQSLLAAYPDRLAKRRQFGSDKGLMVGGRGIRVDRTSLVRSADLFVCVSAEGRGEESLVRMASAVQPEWLPDDNIRIKQERFFHPTLKAVVARDRQFFEDLMLKESPVECQADQQTTAILFAEAKHRLDDILPVKDKSLQSFIARWRFVSDQSTSAELPCTIDDALAQTLLELCATRTSFKELAQAPWLDHLRAKLDYSQQLWLDQHAPEVITVPSGNRIRVEYPTGKPPVLAVRIQEIYGWTETPRLAGGTVPIQLHLLGPNRRPQQITDDLSSFWSTTYTAIRKELKRRYARHHWPDNPANATATHNGLKPKTTT
ncbi:ATP-dependent helicase HrpB [Stieleria sp. TO1_6]|nr:ATP-dependent helicase HrpB [Stieleria tagensis]